MSTIKQIDLNGVKKILVIKLRHIGDVLLTTPLFTNLKKRGFQVDVMVYKESLPILENNPFIDKILTYERKPFFARCKEELFLAKEVFQNGYDLVINLTEGDRGAIFSFISRAPIKVGLKSNNWKDRVFTHFFKTHPLRHGVEKNLDALRRLGMDPQDKELFFHVGNEALERMKSFENSIVIHPMARWKFKCWPHFRQITKELLARNERVVFVASREERDLIDNIVKDLPVENLAGKLTLEELGAIMKLSKLFLCIDSLPLHISSALKVKTITFFGPTSDLAWGPWQNINAKIFSKSSFACRPCCFDGCGGSKISDCLNAISASEVLDYIEKSLPK